MAIEVFTKDCTALSDAELTDMADICVDGPAGFGIGLLTKQRDEWVLITQVRDGNKLLGFSFSTLERIGGTPCLLMGLTAVKRHARRDGALKGILVDQYHRALMAFPDEDVVIGTRMIAPDAYLAFKGLEDIVPRPHYKPTGEERAWGRRLAKRFGFDGAIDDRSFVLQGSGEPMGCFDYETLKPEKIDPEVAELLKGLNRKRGDTLVAFGWAMAETLASNRLGK